MLAARAGEVAIKIPSPTATMLTDTLIAFIITHRSGEQTQMRTTHRKSRCERGAGLDSSPEMLVMPGILCPSHGSFDLSFGQRAASWKPTTALPSIQVKRLQTASKRLSAQVHVVEFGIIDD
jgi:hypothetical protein